ncbi:hypothetical protein BJ322DRAFT_707057 [Thelephora terrestris]|uniref:Uncharacterized protein n=1 Tax=Thelephora terrestris TaxID=56493 RepID=A0A9P6L8I3_9AGAM|nr:hypothetical protein BJ322DRAFT_707057 [Thelephora terrestris]
MAPKVLCQRTKWLGLFYSTTSIVLAKVTIALRVYAVTERNKWFGAVLATLIVTQFITAIYMTVKSALTPSQPLPDINLDPFKVCTTAWNQLQEMLFLNVGIAFEVVAFAAIFLKARKPRHGRYPGIPSLLDAIWRDATEYFLLITLCDILSDAFIIFAPLSIAGLPGLANTMLVPLMASRLMLSLKKAAVEPARMGTASITDNPGRLSVMTRSIQFSSRVPRGFPEVPGAPVSPRLHEGDVLELGSVSRTPWKDCSGYQVDIPPVSRSSRDDLLVARGLPESQHRPLT